MVELHKIKSYFWYLLGIIGVVFFWAGVWDGLGNLSYLQNPLISFLVGLVILTLSGLFFKGLDVFGKTKKTAYSFIRKIKKHKNKHEFDIKYYDKMKKKQVSINAKKFKKIEKDSFMVLTDKSGKEVFIPLHRIKEVAHKGKTHWKG